MCICFSIWTACQATFVKAAEQVPPVNNHAAANAVLAFIFLYYLFYNIAMSPLLVSYTVEILPFKWVNDVYASVVPLSS